MACCGGSNGVRPQVVRKQSVPSPEVSKPLPVQRKLSRSAQPVNAKRQYVMPRQQCTTCGYPAMEVVVAGRERMQCSNANCRIIIS